MKTAKIFKSGNSQAVRIPKKFRLEADEVEIEKKGEALIMRPRKRSRAALSNSLEKFIDDFMEGGRAQPPVQKRGRAFS